MREELANTNGPLLPQTVLSTELRKMRYPSPVAPPNATCWQTKKENRLSRNVNSTTFCVIPDPVPSPPLSTRKLIQAKEKIHPWNLIIRHKPRHLHTYSYARRRQSNYHTSPSTSDAVFRVLQGTHTRGNIPVQKYSPALRHKMMVM